MSGLLVKDFRLMLQRKRFFLFMLVMALVMGFGMQENMAVIVGYLTMISILFCISTMSYDEYDNCYAFLMSLPVERKTYVWEKYIYGFLTGIVAWLISVAVCCVSRGVQMLPVPETAEIAGTLSLLMTGYLMLALIIPLQLKYGMERGRMAMVAAVGAAALVIYLGAKAAENRGIDVQKALENALSGTSTGLLIVGAVAVWILLTGISILVSLGIMEKKEF